eukprot:768603-Hanusia_phi.AAC.3
MMTVKTTSVDDDYGKNGIDFYQKEETNIESIENLIANMMSEGTCGIQQVAAGSFVSLPVNLVQDCYLMRLKILRRCFKNSIRTVSPLFCLVFLERLFPQRIYKLSVVFSVFTAYAGNGSIDMNELELVLRSQGQVREKMGGKGVGGGWGGFGGR